MTPEQIDFIKHLTPEQLTVLKDLTPAEFAAFLAFQTMSEAIRDSKLPEAPAIVEPIATGQTPATPSKRVCQFDKRTGRFVHTHNSKLHAKNAVKSGQGVYECLNGTRKSCGGFIWKYANDPCIFSVDGVLYVPVTTRVKNTRRDTASVTKSTRSHSRKGKPVGKYTPDGKTLLEHFKSMYAAYPHESYMRSQIKISADNQTLDPNGYLWKYLEGPVENRPAIVRGLDANSRAAQRLRYSAAATHQVSVFPRVVRIGAFLDSVEMERFTSIAAGAAHFNMSYIKFYSYIDSDRLISGYSIKRV